MFDCLINRKLDSTFYFIYYLFTIVTSNLSSHVSTPTFDYQFDPKELSSIQLNY